MKYIIYRRYDMKMEWTPQEDGLREILTLLRESQSPDTATQRAVQQVSFFTKKLHEKKSWWSYIRFVYLLCLSSPWKCTNLMLDKRYFLHNDWSLKPKWVTVTFAPMAQYLVGIKLWYIYFSFTTFDFEGFDLLKFLLTQLFSCIDDQAYSCFRWRSTC